MKLIELIERLERLGHGHSDPDGALADLAADLRETCEGLDSAGREAGEAPGRIDALHAIRIGLYETLKAHAEVEKLRRRGAR